MSRLWAKTFVLALIISMHSTIISIQESEFSSKSIIYNADSDNDGIENSIDSCPESPFPTWSNQSIETLLNCETCGRTGMDVKFDSQNNTHVVYFGTNQDSPNEHNEGGMNFLKYAVYDGNTWDFSYVSLVTESDYTNLSAGGNQDGIDVIIDTNTERPLLLLDDNDLPHIVYYTYSGSSDELIRSLRYATYQEFENGTGHKWQKSTIIEGVAECGGDVVACNDIVGFELDSDNKPHIVYRNFLETGNDSGVSVENSLTHSVSNDWLSWNTSQIYTFTDYAENFSSFDNPSSLILDASMSLDSQDQLNIIALTPSRNFNADDAESRFEIIYFKFNGEEIIENISISTANGDGNLDYEYWKRTSVSIVVDPQDLVHLGFINSQNEFTYATLDLNNQNHSITTSMIDSTRIESGYPFHGYYDLKLVIEQDGTPHVLYSSYPGDFSLIPNSNLALYLSFYSVLVDGQWNRVYIGGFLGLPGLDVNSNGLTSIIHFSSHGNDDWSGISLFNLRPVDSDDDNDGCLNFEDQFPYDSSEYIDSDGDGVGDNADIFPNDATETVDEDGDGIGDNLDAFPTQITQWSDYDGDGFGDNYANSSWSTGFTMTGQYVPNAFRQDACPLLPGTSYLGVIPNGEEIVIYGCPDSDGDGYADILEQPSSELDQVSDKEDGFLGLDLDLIGIALSLIIPLIAIAIGWYYSNRKRRSLENLIEVMKTIDNVLDLATWFDLISTDAILNGEINHAQLELLRSHFRRHNEHLLSIQNSREAFLSNSDNYDN